MLNCPAGAQAPADRVFPNGGQVGTTVALTFPAMAAVESATMLVDGDGLKSLGPFVKGVGKVEIAADARPGVRQVRLVGPKAATTPRPFAVTVLPQVLEQEPNDTDEQAQKLPALPLVLNGAVPKGQDVDVYRLSLKKGECLVVAGESRRMAGPANLAVYIRTPAGGTVPTRLSYRRRDPVYTCEVPADGEYLVQLHDVSGNMGDIGEGHLYRLNFTTGPWLDLVLPPGAPRGSSAHLTFHGWNLGGKPGPGTTEADVSVPPDAPEMLDVSAGGAPNRLSLVTGSRSEAAESEPNPPAMPQAISLPVTLNGVFGERGDVDAFRFTARGKETYLFDVEARDLDSLADPVLSIRDASGKVLTTVDDAERSKDPRTHWTAPADGEYTVVLRDVAGNSRGGPGSFYRLSVALAEPELRLTAKDAVIQVKPGAKTEIALTLSQAYQPGEVSLRVEGLPKGVIAEVAHVPASPKRAQTTPTKMVLTAAPDAAPGFAPIRVIAIAEGTPALTAVATWQITGDGGVSLGTGITTQLVLLVPVP